MRVSCLLCVTVLALLSTSVLSALAPVPVFLWSGKQLLSSEQNSELTSVQSSQQVYTLLSGVVSKAPEVVVAFVFNQISPAQYISLMDSEKTKLSVKRAASTLSVPFARLADGGLSDSLMVTATGRVKTERLDSTADCRTIMKNLESVDVSNGRTELTLVRVDITKLALASQCMSSIESALVARTNNYVALFGADRNSVQLAHSFSGHSHGARVKGQSFMNTLSSSVALGSTRTFDPSLVVNTYKYGWPVYITPNILLALMLSFMLIFTVLCGVSQLMAIEAPTRYTAIKLNLGKVDEGK